MATAASGDLTFDSPTTSIVSIDGIDLNIAGAFVNNASLEQPLMKVYDTSVLSISTGNTVASSQAIVLETNGSIIIEGVGLTLTNADFTATATNSITIDTTINSSSAGAMKLVAGDNFILTAGSPLTADSISIEATSGTADISGGVSANSFDLISSGNISQTGTISTSGAISVTSQAGSIFMSGAIATSSSSTGSLSLIHI